MSFRLMLFILLFPLLGISQNIVFTDSNLKSKLLESNINVEIAKDINDVNVKIDSNNDNEISVGEASIVYKLNVSYSNISTINSLASFNNLAYLNFNQNNVSYIDLNLFPNLIYFRADNNNFTSIEILNNNKIEAFSLRENHLTTVKVENCSNFYIIECDGNNINSVSLQNLNNLLSVSLGYNEINNLTLSNFPNLANVFVEENSIQNLSINNCQNLKYLDCSFNLLTNLDLTNLHFLEDVYCHENDLQTINLQGCNNLKSIFAADNNLTHVDLSSCSSLYQVVFENNNLEYLNVNNGIHENAFAICENPNLQQVCVDDTPEEYDHMYFQLVNCGLFNVDIRTDCVVQNIEVDDEVVAGELLIFPNPVVSYLEIHCEKGNFIKSINLYDSCGKLIKEEVLINQDKKVKLDVSDISLGVYYCVIETFKGKEVRKIIKI